MDREIEIAFNCVASLVKTTVSLLGIKTTSQILESVYPDKKSGITLDAAGDLKIAGGKVNWLTLKKVFDIIVDALSKNFGFEFTERIIENLYSNTKERHGQETDVDSLIFELAPQHYLEKERMQKLSRFDLERRVLERTRELEELNAKLDKQVIERTKDLAGANKNLEDKNKQLEKLSVAKSEFLSFVSHQLLVPLAAARWLTNTLEESVRQKVSLEEINLLGQMNENNKRMERLVKNLLNVARIEEGRMEYSFVNLPLRNLLREVISILAPIAKSKGIEIEDKILAINPIVRADHDKLFLVFENIIDNAIKYGEKQGRVYIGLKNDLSAVIVETKNQGIGISKEDCGKIFEKFFRGSNTRDYQASGSGLGLFIVKKIVEDHGGKIWFESELGKETTFFVELPMAK